MTETKLIGALINSAGFVGTKEQLQAIVERERATAIAEERERIAKWCDGETRNTNWPPQTRMGFSETAKALRSGAIKEE